MKKNDTVGVGRKGSAGGGGKVSGKEKAGRGEERRGEGVTGGPGTRRNDVKREGRIESTESFIKKKVFFHNFSPFSFYHLKFLL